MVKLVSLEVAVAPTARVVEENEKETAGLLVSLVGAIVGKTSESLIVFDWVSEWVWVMNSSVACSPKVTTMSDTFFFTRSIGGCTYRGYKANY